MTINISNILAQLNTKMSSDSSASTTDLLRRVKAYNDLNNAGSVFEYQSYGDLPTVDSSNVGQLAYVRSSLDDSFGTFFFAKALVNDSGYLDAIDSTNSGWQKIVLNANDSDNFADIAPSIFLGSVYQGSISGYHSGGRNAPNEINTIEKYSLISDGNSTDVGDLTVLSSYGSSSGNSSSTSGYHTGGEDQPSLPYNIIQKFPFAVDANATDVGDMSVGLKTSFGVTSTSFGYQIGGRTAGTNSSNVDDIEKIDFASDGNSTTITNIITARSDGASITDGLRQTGYIAAGELVGAFTTTIDKFTFSNESITSSVGDLIGGNRKEFAGYQSTTHGYTAGGTPPTIDTIDKFPFSGEGTSTDVANLTLGRRGHASSSSATHGYSSGAFANPPPYTNSIDKFPFAADADATDVGDITSAKAYASGNQV